MTTCSRLMETVMLFCYKLIVICCQSSIYYALSCSRRGQWWHSFWLMDSRQPKFCPSPLQCNRKQRKIHSFEIACRQFIIITVNLELPALLCWIAKEGLRSRNCLLSTPDDRYGWRASSSIITHWYNLV